MLMYDNMHIAEKQRKNLTSEKCEDIFFRWPCRAPKNIKNEESPVFVN